MHAEILRAVRLERPASRALDIGCGAGLSCAVLAPLAEHVIGVEPVRTMLGHGSTVAPGALMSPGTKH